MTKIRIGIKREYLKQLKILCTSCMSSAFFRLLLMQINTGAILFVSEVPDTLMGEHVNNVLFVP
jgi:hypothetical protein